VYSCDRQHSALAKLARRGRRYRLRRQLAAAIARQMAAQTRRIKLRQSEFRPFHFFDHTSSLGNYVFELK
jgi:hypothetical protein